MTKIKSLKIPTQKEMQGQALLNKKILKNQKKYLKKTSKFLLNFLIFIPLFIDISIEQKIKARPINIETLKQSNNTSFVADAVAISSPAVVTIDTQRKIISYESERLTPNFFNDPYLERFFGLKGFNQPRSRIEKGQGSGVIFSTDGLVLTNAHVVAKIDTLSVGLLDGRRISGEVIGIDSLTDLAVIQLKGLGPWPSAPLGNSDDLRVGDWAIAVGNPFGLDNTVTFGIISNLNRNVSQLGILNKRLDLIQTDAAINPGNSGGPLLNASGEVIGINTLIRSGPGAGLGFAIPINKAMNIANQLVTLGKAIHPIIGISLSRNIETNQKNFEGAVIRYLAPGGPGKKAGLKINDLIIYVADKKIISPADVVNEINKNGIKAPLKFTIIRNEKKLTFFIQPIDINDLDFSI